jgi:hypothetical protein
MPIRINLLAEAQAAEELRRRDPAKRASWMAGVIVFAVLVWSGSLQMKLMSDNGRLTRLESSLSNKTNGYVVVISNQQALASVQAKLDALQRLATNRFLQAELLNALQRTTVDGIALTKFRLDQSYNITPDEQPHTVDGKFVPGKPGGHLERILLSMEAKDSSANPGVEAINKLKETLACNPYFQKQNISTNEILLKNVSQANVDAETGRAFVMFNLECRYPDRVR